MAGCVFCQILAGEREADRVFEDDVSVGFLDHRPLFPGHVLVVPREHVETIPQMPPQLVEPLFSSVRRVAQAVERGLGAEGSFVAVNNRVSQTVPHLHVHVVPRRRGDGLRGFFWPRHPYADAAERAAVAGRLREAMASLATLGG